MSEKTDRVRVLVFIKGLGLGGAERLLVDSLPYLDREQFEYEFAYLVPWKNYLVWKIQEAGFTVHLLPMNKPLHLPFVLLKLHALVKRRDYDLIHAHLPVAGIMARCVGKAQGVPVVYSEHNLQESYHPLTAWMNRHTFSWNSAATAVSRDVVSSLSRAGLDRKAPVKTLLNGVPCEMIRQEAEDLSGLREELVIPEGKFVVGTVAVFRKSKRLFDWIETARRVLEQRQDVVFVLAGHGPEEAALKEKVRALHLEGKVIMPGFRPDGRKVIGLMDIFLMSSEFEGLPMALLEAMCLKKPVVATSAGGIPEVICDGEEGSLHSVGDIESLSGSVLRLLSDKDLRMRWGERAEKKVREGFHIRDQVREIEEIYGEVLRATKRKASARKA